MWDNRPDASMSPTPILDRQQPPPAPQKRRKWPARIVGALIGVAIVFLPGFLVPHGLVLLALVPAFFFAVLLHELGHLATGLIAGLSFRKLLVGALMLTHEDRGYRLRFAGKGVMAGGLTVMIPRGPAEIRQKYLLFVAGGPVATLLLFLPVALLPWGR